MKISRNWLQTFFDAPLPSADALSDALTFHAFEIDGIEKIGDDDVLDVKVTANRGHDCLSHRGIAKEISAILNLPLKACARLTCTAGVQVRLAQAPIPLISVSIDTPLCNRYIAGYVRGVKVGPSPAWLVERLAATGQKSINNVVDATNFVMFNIGQPLHAFDAGKLAQKEGRFAISVRTARDGEKLLALDEKEYQLNPSMLVIADANADAAIGVAGVKGGMPAGISESTHDIIIESANFDGPSVRKAAQHMKIRTDASARFEQGIAPELAAYGMRDAVKLIQELAGGEVVGFADAYPHPQEIKPVAVTLAQINAVLGTKLAASDIADVFTRLGFTFEKKGDPSRQVGDEADAFLLTPPFERLDLVIPEDLIEEVGRIIGYDKVPAVQLPSFEKAPEVNQNFYWSERIREHLTEQGFSEVFTSVFTDEGERVVANKIDGVRPFLRSDLSKGLTEALAWNVRNKALLGIVQVRIFEIGTVWKNGKEEIAIGIGVENIQRSKTVPSLFTSLSEFMGIKIDNQEYESTGQVHQFFVSQIYLNDLIKKLPEPNTYDAWPLSTATRYQPFSKYPYIVRDIAMWTPAGTDPDEVLKSIKENSGDLLVKAALFDRFEKSDKTSLAFRLVFQSFEKTLTDEEVNQIMQKVSAALAAQGFEIR